MEAFAASLTAAQRRKLDAAVDALMDREDIAEAYEHLKEVDAGMTRYRHLITDDNRKWWTLGAMCFALFMIMLDNTVVNVALPSIQRDLGASISGLEWTINGYTLSFAVLLATGGRLGDIFGRRRMFLIGVVIFALSSATAGLAADPTALVVSRVVQGVGAALMMPATLSIITDAFPPHERGKAMGTWAGVSGLALAVGPVLGGLLTEHVTWRAIFYLNIPVAVGAVLAALFAVRESRDYDRRPRGRLRRRRRPDRRAHRADPRPGRGQQLGLGVARDRRPAGRLRRRPRRPSSRRAAGQGADGRVPLLLRPQLPRRRRRRPDHLLRDARRLLLPRPLHAGHPRLLAAGGRGPVPALDPDDRRRRADRRPARRPLRPALADRRRAAAADRLAATASAGSRSTRPTSTCCPASCCSASGSR